MKLSKNKKGAMWIMLIAIIFGIIAIGIALKVGNIYKELGSTSLNVTQFGLAGGNTPNVFLFEPKSLSVVKDTNCQLNPNSKNEYTCTTPGKDVYFETEIYNGGAAQRRFYGGFVVCEIVCTKRFLRSDSCAFADKNCVNRVLGSSETCTVKNGVTKICDAGYYTFPKGKYMVYPVTTCFLDEIYGCSEIGMTEAPKERNPDAFLLLTISP